MFCYISHFSYGKILNLVSQAKCAQKLQIRINIFTRAEFVLQSEFELRIYFDILHEIKLKFGYTMLNGPLYFNF
jgi:hypothetical protein